ncbi:type II toxin-antitoxin system VapB family antitoxin [Kitasatospora purpeofusca]|uniref:Type II toxin-antitoxin system VapB family antitoxin n=1 Tax=Kitasatospora purpeofusca TaxID=67352 RepID=A0ABZ1U6B2_9ACTN|nr:type II toxin-antitoxin system VapB family antitoxin [Kitasatospora purpeofusca]
MSVTRIDIDEEVLESAGRQERAARIGRHFERARHWGAVEDAERLHRAEKDERSILEHG